MTPAEKVVALCKERKIAISRLERDLGFANGYIKGLKGGKISAERVKLIGDYLEVPYYEIDSDIYSKESGYYLNDETASIAQDIFENKELRALFSVGRDMSPEDLEALHNMALALKRKERYDGDDPA